MYLMLMLRSTPLNGIIGLAESLLDNNTDPANSTSTLKMIVSCGKRLSNLVNDILDYKYELTFRLPANFFSARLELEP